MNAQGNDFEREKKNRGESRRKTEIFFFLKKERNQKGGEIALNKKEKVEKERERTSKSNK